jgi:DNA-directed RNA polymerase subunit RPC12/RpoP
MRSRAGLATVTQIACDGCHEEMAEAWIYSHGAFRVLIAGSTTVNVRAGGLALCDECQRLWEEGEMGPLMRRIREKLDTHDVRLLEQLHGLLSALMRRVDRPARHVQCESDGQPRRWNYTCLHCAHTLQLEALQRMVSVHCPVCGTLTITQAPALKASPA